MRPPHLRLRAPGLRAAVLLSVAAGVLLAASSVLTLEGFPPEVKPRHTTIAAAATHVVVDAPQSLVGTRRSSRYRMEDFTTRASFFGNLIASPPIRDDIVRRTGIPADELATRSRLTLNVQLAMRDGDLEQRAAVLHTEHRPYKLELQADPGRPVLNVYTQAPSVREAEAMADAAVASLRADLARKAAKHGHTADTDVVLTQLGPARGGVVNGQITPQMLLVTFLVGFGACFAIAMAARGVVQGWTAGPAAPHQPSRPLAAAAPVRTGRPSPEGDWPHTTRVLPWMIAGLTAVFWLVPFNQIQLSVPLPIDAKLDRLVLPVLFAVWALALALGGRAAPRVRMTPIHVGIFTLLTVAGLSVALNAADLNQTMEFDLAFKKLTLLTSYVMAFLIIASSVRPTEVPAFLKLNLSLASLCALGAIWEYRFHFNVFYELADILLPGLFSVGQALTNARDDIGRVMLFGPSEHPLELASMLTMALPIALVGILQSKERRTRLLYGFSACLLLAAAIATYRKSALLGPAFVVLTIAYFRRRELVRLAPLGFAALAAIHVLSPGAFGSILFQLQPDRLGVATVSDRASDYDAVRPDIWSHLAFGRGYGSYDHLSYRILDSEQLSRLVDTGILGVLALFFMLFCIVGAARPLINGRHPDWSPPALAVAASAVAFLVFTFLFDVTSFPHVPYILLGLAALLAVVVSGASHEAPAPDRGLPVRELPVTEQPPVVVRERVREPVGG